MEKKVNLIYNFSVYFYLHHLTLHHIIYKNKKEQKRTLNTFIFLFFKWNLNKTTIRIEYKKVIKFLLKVKKVRKNKIPPKKTNNFNHDHYIYKKKFKIKLTELIFIIIISLNSRKQNKTKQITNETTLFYKFISHILIFYFFVRCNWKITSKRICSQL